MGQVSPRTYDRLESDTSLGPLEQLLKRDGSFQKKKSFEKKNVRKTLWGWNTPRWSPFLGGIVLRNIHLNIHHCIQ